MQEEGEPPWLTPTNAANMIATRPIAIPSRNSKANAPASLVNSVIADSRISAAEAASLMRASTATSDQPSG